MIIHPFPARMAPELVDEKIAELPECSHILDPMCGSGIYFSIWGRIVCLIIYNCHLVNFRKPLKYPF